MYSYSTYNLFFYSVFFSFFLMADVVMCFKSPSCTSCTRSVRVMAESVDQEIKKRSILCISCIQTLVTHKTVELYSTCGSMFSGICVHVLSWVWSSGVCVRSGWLALRLRAAIFSGWWASLSEVNHVTCTLASGVEDREWVFKKKKKKPCLE